MRSQTPGEQAWAGLLAAAVLWGAALLWPGQLLWAAGALAAPGAAAQMLLRQSDPAAPQPVGEQACPPGESPPLPAATPAATAVPEYPAVALWDDSRRPEVYGTVTEKHYPHGSGEKYILCGSGSIKNNTRLPDAQVAALAAQELPFAVELNSSQPQVLVMHTHATETYRLSEGLWYLPEDTARSTDTAVNMCAVGDVLADALNAAGINTLHDATLNDYPSYNASYGNSRAVVQRYLAQYPSIKVVLDVHRDAIETSGSRIAPVCTVGGVQAAQVMLIAGCDNGTTVKLPDYPQNLAFAAAWERTMEGMYPGFTRPVLFSYRFYNQDLTPGSLLIEIGGHGNNLNEALAAGRLAGNALARLFGGEPA